MTIVKVIRAKLAQAFLFSIVISSLIPVTALASWCWFATTADGWTERVEPGGFYITCDNVPVCQATQSETASCVSFSPTVQVSCTRDDGGGSYTQDYCQTRTDDGCDNRDECNEQASRL
jgi:hypothetical protein